MSSPRTNAHHCSRVHEFVLSARTRPAAPTSHACACARVGFDTPGTVAGANTARTGLIADTYFVPAGRRSPRSRRHASFPAPDTLPVLEAFARFPVRLKSKESAPRISTGPNHLWDTTATAGTTASADRHQPHEIPTHGRCARRMHDQPAGLSCPAVPFLYILDRYADIRGWDINRTRCAGDFLPPALRRPVAVQKAVPGTKSAAQQKQTLRLDSANILLHLSLLIPTRRGLYGFAYYFFYFFFY